MIPVFGSMCRLFLANSSSGSSSHSAEVRGLASSNGSSLIGIGGVPLVVLVVPFEVFSLDDSFEVGEGEEVFFIRLVLERFFIVWNPRPRHAEGDELGGDDRRLATEIQDQPRRAVRQEVPPEIDLTQILVVVHPGLHARDTSADPCRRQGRLPVRGQMTFGANAEAPLVVGHAVKTQVSGQMAPE